MRHVEELLGKFAVLVNAALILCLFGCASQGAAGGPEPAAAHEAGGEREAGAAPARGEQPPRAQAETLKGEAPEEAPAADVAVYPQLGHSSGVFSLAYSPDGKYLASGSDDKEIKIWDTLSWRELRTLSGHTGPVNSVGFSPNGEYIISGSEDRTIRIWKTADGTEVEKITGHLDGVNSAAFNPDGLFVISGSDDETVRVWKNGKEYMKLTYSSKVSSAAYSPDGKQIVSALYDGVIKIHNAHDGSEILNFTFGATDNAGLSYYNHNYDIVPISVIVKEQIRLSVAFSPDGKKIVLGSSRGILGIYDAENGNEIIKKEFDNAAIWSVVYNKTGNRIACSFLDGSIRVFNTADGGELFHIRKFDSWYDMYNVNTDLPALGLAFSPDDQYLAAGLRDSSIHILKTESWNEYRNLIWKNDGITAIAIDGNNKYIASGTAHEGKIYVWNIENGTLFKTLTGHTGEIRNIIFDNDKIISDTYDDVVKTWFIESGHELSSHKGRLKEPRTSFDSDVYSPDKRYQVYFYRRFLTGSNDDRIILLRNSAAHSQLRLIGHLYTVFSVAFTPDGTRLVSGSGDGTTRVWDAATGKEIAAFIAFTDGEWIVITPDGYYNASPKGDQYLNVRIGNEVYGIDQFAAAFYHPEVVEARLRGLPDPPVVKERGSIQTASVPPAVKVTVDGENAAPGQAVLSVTATDWIRRIKGIEIIVNGRLVGGGELRPLSASGLTPALSRLEATSEDRQYEFTIPVRLDPGLNHIEVVAANDFNYGLKTVYVNSPRIQEQKGDLWVLAIGVNDYADNPDYADLRYAVSDAEKIAGAFAEQEGKRFNRVHTLVISDNGEVKPAKEEILGGMEFLKQAGPDDVAALFVAAHGKTEDGVYYFLPADAVFTGNGKFDPGTAVSIDDLTRGLDIPGRKLVFLDTCESGGVDNNRLVRTLKNRSTVIFTASRQEEFSYENALYGGGFFTHGITAGLTGEAAEGGTVLIGKLGEYVAERVSRISRDRQHPEKFIPDGYRDFVITVAE